MKGSDFQCAHLTLSCCMRNLVWQSSFVELFDHGLMPLLRTCCPLLALKQRVAFCKFQLLRMLQKMHTRVTPSPEAGKGDPGRE